MHKGIAYLQKLHYNAVKGVIIMEIKDLIKIKRNELGLTLDDVAHEIGVSAGTISRWESGDIKNMRRDKIGKLARLLNISPAVIMGWEPAYSADIPTKVCEECEPYSVQSCAIPISDDENELLCAYRSATEKGRNMAMGILISNQEEEVFRSQKQA